MIPYRIHGTIIFKIDFFLILILIFSKSKLEVHHKSKEPHNIGLYLVTFCLKTISKFN
jgi:hypothetical protein